MKCPVLVTLCSAILSRASAASIQLSEEVLEKRGIFHDLFCIKGEDRDNGSVYGIGAAGCTESTHSFDMSFHSESPTEVGLPLDPAFTAMQKHLNNIVSSLRSIEEDLLSDSFDELTREDQLKQLCAARNLREINKIKIQAFGPLDWTHYFCRAAKENLTDLDQFQTNIKHLFESSKYVLQAKAEELNFKGLFPCKSSKVESNRR